MKVKAYYTDDHTGNLKSAQRRLEQDEGYRRAGQVSQETLRNDPAYLEWLDEIEQDMKQRQKMIGE